MAEQNSQDTHVREAGHGAAAAGVEHVGAPEHHPAPTALGLSAPQYIALAMVVVFAILLWKRVPALIGRALDSKIAAIRAQLDEAAQLRSEAEAIRAEYEAKSAQADSEAAAMLERARIEAEGIVRQAESDASALVERRGRMAEDKIAAAERSALDQVRAKAAAAAAAAAETLIREKLDAGADKALVDRTIAGLGQAH
ncbi:MAG TPA: F0F1 ATP synthase subunit B [Allosphingosinicella sp.]|jgi:F-type H+-transporting ATPase subunit b